MRPFGMLPMKPRCALSRWWPAPSSDSAASEMSISCFLMDNYSPLAPEALSNCSISGRVASKSLRKGVEPLAIMSFAAHR
jgi:hypothetical protein